VCVCVCVCVGVCVCVCVCARARARNCALLSSSDEQNSHLIRCEQIPYAPTAVNNAVMTYAFSVSLSGAPLPSIRFSIDPLQARSVTSQKYGWPSFIAMKWSLYRKTVLVACMRAQGGARCEGP
jgi:hypothetical protein